MWQLIRVLTQPNRWLHLQKHFCVLKDTAKIKRANLSKPYHQNYHLSTKNRSDFIANGFCKIVIGEEINFKRGE